MSVSLTIGPSDDERYGWPGIEPGVLDAACVPIARHLVRAGRGRVGFVPAAGALPPGAEVGPLVMRVATAALAFVSQEVAIIDTWRTWAWGKAMEPGDPALYRERRLRPRLIELAPVPCGDPDAATIALDATMTRRPQGLALVLVNLAGYGAAGVMPAALDSVDGVVLLARAGHTRLPGLQRMARFLPPDKNLGTVLFA